MSDNRAPVALVTGASRGIGRAIALELAAVGYEVVVNYRSSAAAAEAVRSEIAAKGGTAVVRCANVGDSRAAEELVQDILSDLGRIDALINNAGNIPPNASWTEMDVSSWREVVDVNVGSMIWLSRAVAPHMHGKGGCIVNIGSVYGEIGAAAVLGYTVAKAGVTAVTRALAKELAPTIRVNAVSPGNIDTDMTRKAGAELINQVVRATPLGRLGTAHEVAQLVRFLITEATFITGATIVIDGGFLLR